MTIKNNIQYKRDYYHPDREQCPNCMLIRYQSHNVDIKTIIETAKKLNLYIPDNLKLDRYGAINISEIKKTVTLIENLLECGSMTAILEHKNIEPNIISILLMNSLYGSRNNTVKHLKNLSSSKTTIVFIDSQDQQRYMRQLQALNCQNKNNFLYRTDFLEAPIDEGFNIFKNALHESSAQVVIFDTDFLSEINNRKISILKMALRYCKTKNIAVALILRNNKMLNFLPAPDRSVHIWDKDSDRFSYIVEPETRLREDEICPFSLEFKEGRWKSETLSQDILRKIPERTGQNSKPGIDPSMEIALKDLSQNLTS